MDYSLLLSIHSTRYVIDANSIDIIPQNHSKRKVTYAICRPDSKSESFLKIQDSMATEDEETDLGSMTEASDLSEKWARSCRFSVLGPSETDFRQLENPLVSKHTSSTEFGTFGLANSSSDNLQWLGKRSMEKEGFIASAVVGPDFYTFGVVDMLQTWTWQKRLERVWKTVILRQDGNGISAAPPKQYAERFKRKMHDIMTVPHPTAIGFGLQ